MSKAFSKVLVMTLMLVAFVGQAFAYSAMPCEMSSGSHESHMNMNMDHGDMNKKAVMVNQKIVVTLNVFVLQMLAHLRQS